MVLPHVKPERIEEWDFPPLVIPRWKFFSLKMSWVEGFTVVAIIGILFALLIPGFDQDRTHRFPPAKKIP